MSTVPIKRGVVFKKVTQNDVSKPTLIPNDQNKVGNSDGNSISLNTPSAVQQVPVLNIPSKTTDATSMFINQDQMSSASSDGLPASHETVLDWGQEVEMTEQSMKAPAVKQKKYVPSFDLKMKSSPVKSAFAGNSPVTSSTSSSNFASYTPSYSSNQGFQPKRMELSSHTPPTGYEQMHQQSQAHQMQHQYQSQPNAHLMYQNNPQQPPQLQQQTASNSYLPYVNGSSIVISIVPGNTPQMVPSQMMMMNPEPPKQPQPVYATPMPDFTPDRGFQAIQKPVPVKQEYMPHPHAAQASTVSPVMQTSEPMHNWQNMYGSFQKSFQSPSDKPAMKEVVTPPQETASSNLQSPLSVKSRPVTPANFEEKLFGLHEHQQHTKGLRPGSRCPTPGLISQQQQPVEPMSYANAFKRNLDATAFTNVVMPSTARKSMDDKFREEMLKIELQNTSSDENHHRECRDMYEFALNRIRAPHLDLTEPQMMTFFNRTYTQEELEQPPQEKYTNIKLLQNYENIIRWGADAAYTHIPPQPTKLFTFRPVNPNGYIVPQFGPVPGMHSIKLTDRDTAATCVDPNGTIVTGTVKKVDLEMNRDYKKAWVKDGGKMHAYALFVATMWVDEAFPGIIDTDWVVILSGVLKNRQNKRFDEIFPQMRADPINNHFCPNKLTEDSCKMCRTFRDFMYHLTHLLILVTKVQKASIPWYNVYGMNYYAVNGLLAIKPSVDMLYKLGVIGTTAMLSVDLAIYEMSNQDLEVWITCIYTTPDKEYLKRLRTTHIIDYNRGQEGENSVEQIHKGHTCCHRNTVSHICLACFKLLKFAKRNVSAEHLNYKTMEKMLEEHTEIPTPDESIIESVD